MRAPVHRARPTDPQPTDPPLTDPQATDPRATDPQATDRPLTDPQPEVRMSRRERRAAARGAVPTGKIAGRAGAKPPPPLVRHRDYAARKHG